MPSTDLFTFETLINLVVTLVLVISDIFGSSFNDEVSFSILDTNFNSSSTALLLSSLCPEMRILNTINNNTLDEKDLNIILKFENVFIILISFFFSINHIP